MKGDPGLRHAFPEWYLPSEREMSEILQKGVIALDANVLLHLYRLGREQREQVLEVFSHGSVRNRLWVPNQAAYEYQKNRLSVARSQGQAYESVCKDLDKARSAVIESVNQKIRDTNVRNEIRSAVETAISQLIDQIHALKSEHVIEYSEIRSNDPIRESLDEILSEPDQVGPVLSESDRGARVAASEDRYKREVPPGYKDASKSGNPEGDYLIWCEILDRAAAEPRPVLFVTGDTKEDWYQLDESNQTIGPRPELRREFAERSSGLYHQTTLDGFLRLAQTHLDLQIQEDTIQTVADVEESRARAKGLSQLRHPSIFESITEALMRSPAGSRQAEILSDAVGMVEGRIPFDPKIAAVAAEIAVSHAMRSQNQDDDQAIMTRAELQARANMRSRANARNQRVQEWRSKFLDGDKNSPIQAGGYSPSAEDIDRLLRNLRHAGLSPEETNEALMTLLAEEFGVGFDQRDDN